jgi:predicted nucleic acid-binding protein
VTSAVTEGLVCLDTGVWIKYLVVEEPPQLTEAAVRLVDRALAGERLVAPGFAWAEVGSVLRKKVRFGVLAAQDAAGLWTRFLSLPIDYVEAPDLRGRAWEIAERYALPTLYDAAFLACTELASAPTVDAREFWTADEALVQSFGASRPPYLRLLGIDRWTRGTSSTSKGTEAQNEQA